MSKQFHDEDDFFNLYQPKEKSDDSSVDDLLNDWDTNDIYSGQPPEEGREIFSSAEKKAMTRFFVRVRTACQRRRGA